MNHKITELAYLRNQLASGNFTDADKKLIDKMKHNIHKFNTPFEDIIANAISNCEKDIEKGKLKSAAQEIQLIHNFPINEPKTWNSDYFYKVELLSYLEQINDVDRIKKLISILAKLQKTSLSI